MTLSKTCLEMVTGLGDAFAMAAKNIDPPKTKAIPGTAPFVIYNFTGLGVELLPSDSLNIDRAGGGGGKFLDYAEVAFAWHKGGAETPNEKVVKILALHVMRRCLLVQVKKILAQKTDPAMLTIRFPTLKTVREVDISRADLRTFELPIQSHASQPYRLVRPPSSSLIDSKGQGERMSRWRR